MFLSVQKLIKAMGTPSVINAMLSNPDAVRGAELTTGKAKARLRANSAGGL